MSESKHIYIVYRTTNLVNHKIYIGVHHQDFHFPVLFDGYLGSGLNLQMAIKKYGKENFIRETLFVYYTSEEAYAKEREIVNEAFIARKDTYNICIGGQGGPLRQGYKNSKEMIRKMSETKRSQNLSGENSPIYGIPKSASHRKNLSKACMGRKLTEITKQKISEKLSGENHPLFGKHHTEETKQKIGDANRGRKHTEEAKKKISFASSGSNNPMYGKTGKDHPAHGNKLSEETKQKMSESAKKRPTIKCPHCGKEGKKPAMMSRHFNNCKFKTP